MGKKNMIFIFLLFFLFGYIALAQPESLKWRFRAEYKITSSPTIDPDGTIYVGSYDNYLYAIKQDGSLKWRFRAEYKITSSPAIGPDGTIYVGSWDCYLYALKEDGDLKWKFKTDFWIQSSPAIGLDGTIYVGSWDHCLYAICSESEGYQLASPWPGFHYNYGRGRISKIGSP